MMKQLEQPLKGNSQAGCRTCGRVFSTDSNFDRHRKGGDCLDPASRGMEKVDGVWKKQMTDEKREEMRLYWAGKREEQT